jgi:uncharacterized protein (DUF58 family)
LVSAGAAVGFDSAALRAIADARRIEIRTRRLVDGTLAGHYQSVFRGSGIEFAEVRDYTPGDDIRAIDWNVTARLGFPYVKRHVEERELTVMLLVDVSASQRFGSVQRLKSEVAAQLCGLIAGSAVRNNDRVGMILFTDQIERHVTPAKGRNQILRIVRELLAIEPSGRGTDLAGALEQLHRVIRRRSVTFILSDFLGTGYERALRLCHNRHDLIPVCISDRRERELPLVGLLRLRDLETGREVLLDTLSPAVRRAYAERWEKALAARHRLFRILGIDMIEIDAGADHVAPLLRFFRRREKRLGEGR